jgi:hypothetical protein
MSGIITSHDEIRVQPRRALQTVAPVDGHFHPILAGDDVPETTPHVGVDDKNERRRRYAYRRAGAVVRVAARVGQRELDGEQGAARRRVIDADGPARQIHEIACTREPETRAAEPARPGFPDLKETFEHRFSYTLRRHALHRGATGADTCGMGVVPGVGKDVDEGAAERLRSRRFPGGAVGPARCDTAQIGREDERQSWG